MTTNSLVPVLATPRETLPENWSYALVERERSSGEIARRWEIVDLKTEPIHRYLCEPLNAIRVKCALAATMLPVYTAAYMAWHIARAPLSSVQVFFQSLEDFLKAPCSLKTTAGVFFRPPAQFLSSIWSAVRAPFYMLKMQGAALYGIYRPLEGRKWTGEIECNWKNNCSSENDFRRMRSDENLCPFIWRACIDKDFPHPFYFTYCFQPYGALDDENVRSVQFY